MFACTSCVLSGKTLFLFDSLLLFCTVSASGHCGVSSGVLFALSVTFITKFAVARGSAGLVLLCCCELQPSDDFSAFFAIILLDVVNLSALALLFGKETTHRSSRWMISISSTEPLSLLFRRRLVCGVFLKAFLPRALLFGGIVLQGTETLLCHQH